LIAEQPQSQKVPLYALAGVYLIYASVAMVFLFIAAVGTSYQYSFSQTVQARVSAIELMCRYQRPSVHSRNREMYYVLPCNYKKAIQNLNLRGFVFVGQSAKKFSVQLKDQPPVFTTITLSNADAGTLHVGSLITVRAQKIRNSERVELAQAFPRHLGWWSLFKTVGAVYLSLWIVFITSYFRQKRRTLKVVT
jgi:hypothetical protein